MKSKKEGLSLQAIVLFKSIYNMTHADTHKKDGEGRPVCTKKKQKFATEMRLSVRSIHIHLNELIECGLIESKRIKSGNYAGKVGIYVNDDVYEEYAREMEKMHPERKDPNRNKGNDVPATYKLILSCPVDFDLMGISGDMIDRVKEKTKHK